MHLLGVSSRKIIEHGAYAMRMGWSLGLCMLGASAWMFVLCDRHGGKCAFLCTEEGRWVRLQRWVQPGACLRRARRAALAGVRARMHPFGQEPPQLIMLQERRARVRAIRSKGRTRSSVQQRVAPQCKPGYDLTLCSRSYSDQQVDDEKAIGAKQGRDLARSVEGVLAW